MFGSDRVHRLLMLLCLLTLMTSAAAAEVGSSEATVEEAEIATASSRDTSHDLLPTVRPVSPLSFWWGALSFPLTGDASLPGSTWGDRGAETGGGAGLELASAEDKKRVTKPETRRKGERDTDDEKEDEEDEDEDDDCFFSCLGDMFIDSLISDDDEEDEDEEQEEDRRRMVSESYGAASPPAAPTSAPPPRDGMTLLASIGGWKSGPSEVSDEYKDGGWSVELATLHPLSKSFRLGLELGYGRAVGNPLFNYETSTRRDLPSDSRLAVLTAGLKAGQMFQLSGGTTSIFWSIGPQLAWVKESAWIRTVSLPDGALIDEGEIALERWRLGGDVSIGSLGKLGTALSLGFTGRVSFVPSNGKRKASLTTDFIGGKTLIIYGIGLTVGFHGK